jgi:hypothetical protein
MQVYLLKYDLLATKEGVITVTALHSKFIQNQTSFSRTERHLEVLLKFI